MTNKDEVMEGILLENGQELLEDDFPDIIDYEFDRVIKFEGEDYKKITINLEGLTGKDIKDVTRELALQGEAIGLAETNKVFLATLAARAANLPAEFMDYIPAKDFSKITVDVQNFLLG